jgi:indole-3-pyruvate monooxygenase
MTKEIIWLGMTLVQHIPINIVDDLLVRMSDFVFGDLPRHGIVRPKLGSLLLKAKKPVDLPLLMLEQVV